MKLHHPTVIFLLLVMLLPTKSLNASYENTIPPVDHHVHLLPWEEVEKIIPRKTTFSIIDVETGKKFNVQRRAGSHHADVQPLAKKDTKIMKSIYKEWSWKRRSAVVFIDGQYIAASMNGMPHGAGALRNGFNGHFCLHFLNSTTHRSSEPDPAHHLMILKAAGKIDDYLSKSSPEQIIDVLMLAINNTDRTLLDKVISNSTDRNSQKIFKMYVTNWSSQTSQEKHNDSFTRKLRTKVEIYIRGSGTITTTIPIEVERDPVTSKWKVNISPLLKMVN